MIKTKTTIEDLAQSIKTLANKMVTKDDFVNFATKDDLKSFATKDDLKNFATKDDLKDNLAKFATKDDLKEEIENLAIMTKQSFEEVDFKFTVINDRFCDIGKRFDKLENKLDKVHQETIQNSDAFAQLKKYVDSETAATRYHLLRVDEKIGLAGA